MQEWIVFQRHWLFLVNIFDNATLSGSLAFETKKFKELNYFFSSTVSGLMMEPKVSRVVSRENFV